MMRFSFLALLLIALASPSLSLKCYKCGGGDCEKETAQETECSTLGSMFTPICMKVESDDSTVRSCSSKVVCEAAAMVSEKAAEHSIDDAPMTYCCEGDLCNGAPAPLAGLGLLLAPALAYLAA